MTTYRCRSAFISDVHLGTLDCNANNLLDFLRQLHCEKLYLVGDIIDLQALARRPSWPAAHTLVLLEILKIARRGVQVIYIPGNHDAPLRALAGQSFGGVLIALDAEHRGIDGRRYHVSHGDEFDPENIGSRWMIQCAEALHRFVCWGSRRVNSLRRRMAMPYLPLSIIVKAHIGRVLAYIQAYEERVASDARQRGFDGHICGHIHFGRVRDIDGVLYLNDGDWVEHCTALIETSTGAMELLHWNEQSTSPGIASQAPPLDLPAMNMHEGSDIAPRNAVNHQHLFHEGA